MGERGVAMSGRDYDAISGKEGIVTTRLDSARHRDTALGEQLLDGGAAHATHLGHQQVEQRNLLLDAE